MGRGRDDRTASEQQRASSGPASPPVTLTARRLAVANKLWEVYLDDVVDKRGINVKDYLVLKPKGCGIGEVAGVCVVPLLADPTGGKRILLLRSYRHPLEGAFWEGARGFVDPGEQPEAAALRELTEETGHACEARDLLPLGTMAQEPSTLAARVALYAALNCRLVGEQVKDEIGLGDLHEMQLSEALIMAGDGRIEDASTLITLFRLEAWRRRQATGV